MKSNQGGETVTKLEQQSTRISQSKRKRGAEQDVSALAAQGCIAMNPFTILTPFFLGPIGMLLLAGWANQQSQKKI